MVVDIARPNDFRVVARVCKCRFEDVTIITSFLVSSNRFMHENWELKIIVIPTCHDTCQYTNAIIVVYSRFSNIFLWLLKHRWFSMTYFLSNRISHITAEGTWAIGGFCLRGGIVISRSKPIWHPSIVI